MSILHQTYAPVLRFAKGERFHPMRVEDFMAYSSLFTKGVDTPLASPGSLTPDRLFSNGRSPHVFLRSVDAGPRAGTEVVAQWGKSAVELVYQWALKTRFEWSDDLARAAYKWFSPKTSGATSLFWWNSLLAPLLQGPRSGQELPRLILPLETRDNAADRYASQAGRAPAYTYYYRHVRDGSYLCLQYWFFYSYNDWARGFGGMNDHEGDWESMMLFFRLSRTGTPQQPPAYVTFVGHHSRITKPWDHHDVMRVGTHPVGYVAAGSHATYPEAKPYTIMELYGLIDHATGDGLTIDHDDWAQRIDLNTVPWLTAYQGSWGTRYWLVLERARTILGLLGAINPALAPASSAAQREVELPGVSAPHGPMIGDSSAERPQWAGPVAWAGVPPA